MRPVCGLFLLGLATGWVHAQTFSFSTFAGAWDFTEQEAVDATGSSARLNAGQLAIDGSGNIYFAQRENDHTVRRISPAGVVTTVAGIRGVTGAVDGPSIAATFNSPSGVAVDSTGNIYVADTANHLVRKITPAGIVSTLAGQVGEPGEVDGTGRAARLSLPSAIALDPDGNLVVGTNYYARGGIRKITPAGVVTTIVRSLAPSAPADFHMSTSFAFNGDGTLYFTDSEGRTIRKITPAGTVVVVAGKPGQSGAKDGTGSAALFAQPSGIVKEASGNFLVADRGGTIRRVTPEGAVTTIAGQGLENAWIVVDGLGGDARLRHPEGLALDSAGNLFVADEWGRIIRKGVPTASLSSPIITESPSSEGMRNVGARSTVTFTSAATGSPPIAFQWLKDGVALPSATLPSLTIASATAADEGAYAVRVSNAVGVLTSGASTLRVFTPAFEAFTPRRAVTGGSFLWGIASDARRLVTVGTGGTILSSTDGKTWVPRVSGTSDWLVGVTYAANQFVVVGDRGTILTSPEGVAWTHVAQSGTTQRLNNVVFGGGRFVAVGEGGAIVTSPDARTWTAESSGVTTWLRGLVYVPQKIVGGDAVGDDGTGRFYAAGQNGILLERVAHGWRKVLLNLLEPNRDIEALAEGPVGIGQEGALIRMSSYAIYQKVRERYPDGSVGPSVKTGRYWWQSTSGLSARFRGLAHGAGALFATGEKGAIAAAPDASGPWSFIPSGTMANLVNGVFHGNSFFVVGENETILQSQPLYPSRLINIATRGQVGGDANAMISGFVISGPVPKTVLLRVAGPALAGFKLKGTLPAPMLALFDGAARPLATNRGWSAASNAADIAAAAVRVGAFPFVMGSADAALLITLDPGAYTAQVTDADGAGGLALVEAYDAETLATEGSRAINISTRGHVGAGADRLIAGFVINGAASRRVLIRAVGPSLAEFGLTGLLAEPQIELFHQSGLRVRQAGAWDDSDEIAAAGIVAGAFPLTAGSKDAATVISLPPGSYTVQVSGLNDTTGLAIVEVYDLP